MKTLQTLLLSFLLPMFVSAQISGNANYQEQVRYPDKIIEVNFKGNDIVVNVKGLSNIDADAYTAIFNTTQVGKTAEETNQLLDARIEAIERAISNNAKGKLYVDVVSFVPIYEYEVEKKIFSKKSYNEVPKGFELKKNLHIEYTDPDFLNDLIVICAQQEIYNLVKVDYVCTHMEEQKRELRTKAKAIITEKMNYYAEVSGIALDSLEKEIVDEFKVFYPVERYKSYQAYSSSALTVKKNSKVSSAKKATTLYYQPIVDKEFDFVVNPTINEPVIQLVYNIKLKVKRKPKPPVKTVSKEYFILLPDGTVKKLELN